ncbi:5-guanidino-2-oxopentanoate decarboxylase [Paraburkholderia aspalathi]|uniref:5-guanidino-2-oxopentanoate decarboxylase n=1 Tax=Paraburkholderia aspalathi TaxID=1324617 RepID=UPI00190C1393|nr:5-guanidino-2-oxopentanoate decarboxylase [Paraburkholderia aspalathi]MBK3844577.1 5-guanidino-2-oxopentanoate decarboxylase [Paraburkholderia aspalathi]CAE6871022.1 putative 2-ketoarginine decarboxylase AruI [Paraburkholderia aspalathi]
MKTVGMYLVELLAAYGVDTVFGIPGVHTIDLYRGLSGSKVRHITARHEQGLGFMADGYARATGRPGVCFVITGPGVTNIATAMAQAYADSIPMLVISSVNALGQLGSGNGHLHELPDQRQLTSGVAEFSHTVTRAEELPQVVARAFAVFSSGRPRPVHIELPLDVITASARDLPAIPTAPPRVSAGPAAPRAIEEALELFGRARAPLILAGGGALAAADEVRWFAQALDAPVVMTINGRGILPPEHALGISWSASSEAVRVLMRESDLIVALGTELGPTDYDLYANGSFVPPANLVRIDIDAQQLFRNAAPTLPMLGDVGETLAALRQGWSAREHRGDGAARTSACRAAGERELDAVTRRDLDALACVRQALPDASIVGDSTRFVYSGNIGYAAPHPRSWFNASVGFGSLGYGLPAAIGASLGDASRPVVCLAGDGGFQFTLGELGTAAQHGARVIVLLLNNGGYGEIKSAMLHREVEPIGVDLHTPDFVAIARAYGWAAERLDEGTPLTEALARAAQQKVPSLIEITAA